MKYIVFVLFSMTIAYACSNSTGSADDQSHGHDHGAIAILLFEDNMELFAESDQLFAGHGVDIRAHLTFLENYSPAQEGILYARIVVEGQSEPDWEPLELVQPGIFTGSVSPESTGDCHFDFMYEEEGVEVVFSMEALKVYSHDDDPPVDTLHSDEAIFTKEQAWKTPFGLMPIQATEFKKSIHCSGEIVISPGQEVDVISPADGKIAYSGLNMVEGSYVEKGAELFTLSGAGLSSDNIILVLNTARAEYERSKANLERKEELLKLDAVSRKEYQAAKATYEMDKTRYDILKSQIDESGIVVKSPVSGYISEVLITESSFAQTGMVLVKIIQDGGLLIKANVPGTYSNRIKLISSANIKLPHYKKIFSIDEWGGEIRSIGKSVDALNGMIPVFFAVDHPDLVPGTFVELWLLAEAIAEQMVIPQTSLLEEYGRYYVYVQEEGEAYEKRLVQLADSDGVNYLVKSGLSLGEIIVSKGSMAIKVANAMGAAPVHSH